MALGDLEGGVYRDQILSLALLGQTKITRRKGMLAAFIDLKKGCHRHAKANYGAGWKEQD